MQMRTAKVSAYVMHIGQEMTALFGLPTMYVILGVSDVQVLMLTIVLRVSNMPLVTHMGTVAARHTGHQTTAHSSWVTATRNATVATVPTLVIV